MFYLLNKEFTFTVDVSTLECGLNGALYFVKINRAINLQLKYYYYYFFSKRSG